MPWMLCLPVRSRSGCHSLWALGGTSLARRGRSRLCVTRGFGHCHTGSYSLCASPGRPPAPPARHVTPLLDPQPSRRACKQNAAASSAGNRRPCAYGSAHSPIPSRAGALVASASWPVARRTLSPFRATRVPRDSRAYVAPPASPGYCAFTTPNIGGLTPAPVGSDVLTALHMARPGGGRWTKVFSAPPPRLGVALRGNPIFDEMEKTRHPLAFAPRVGKSHWEKENGLVPES